MKATRNTVGALLISVAMLFSFGMATVSAVNLTLVLNGTGWSDPRVGTWDSLTQVGTLTTDVTEAIQIDGDNIMLDGNGHNVVGTAKTGAGISVIGRTGVSVRNVNVTGFNYGILLSYATHSRVYNIDAEGNNYGIRLENSNNNSIHNTIASHNSATGIYAEYSDYNDFTLNTASSNGFGIFLGHASYNTLDQDTTALNGLDGISFDSNATHNTLSAGISTQNSRNGILLSASADYTTVTNTTTSYNGVNGLQAYFSHYNSFQKNTFSHNLNGLQMGSFATDTSIENNTISNNSNDGILMIDFSGANVFKANLVVSNGTGIAINSSSTGNSIYHNNFLNNITQATGEVGNDFSLNLPQGGNHWSDWTTPDANADGIVDNPYVFSGGIDFLPWVKQDGWLAPPDTIAPTTTASFNGTVGNNGWYVSDVTVTLTATDNAGGSGVASTQYSLDGSIWNTYTSPFTVNAEGATTVSWRSRDVAGNVELTQSKVLSIDKSIPVITNTVPFANAEYLLNQNVAVNWTASDVVSGLASSSGTLSSGSPLNTSLKGTNTFIISAQDNAGNSTNTTVTYYVRYVFGGFLPPINADGSSVFKLKGNIPVRFQLQDANGAFVTNAVAILSVVQVGGTSSSPPTTSITFKYDVDNNQYFVNLNAKNLAPGTWQLIVTLDDGTVHSVNISLK